MLVPVIVATSDLRWSADSMLVLVWIGKLVDAGVPAVTVDTSGFGVKVMETSTLRTGLPQAPRVLFL